MVNIIQGTINAFGEMTKENSIIILFITVISFLICLIGFFVLLLGEYYQEIILEKVNMIVLYAKENESFKKQILESVKEYNISPEKPIAEEMTKKRKANNLNALVKMGPIPYTLVFVILFVIYLGWIAFKKRYLKRQIAWSNKVDWPLVILALGAFVVEIIFYIVIISNWKILSDTELIHTLLDENIK